MELRIQRDRSGAQGLRAAAAKILNAVHDVRSDELSVFRIGVEPRIRDHTSFLSSEPLQVRPANAEREGAQNMVKRFLAALNLQANVHLRSQRVSQVEVRH